MPPLEPGAVVVNAERDEGLPVSSAALYRASMTLRPEWTNANLLIYPSFNDNASGTPGIYSRDLSGLVN